MMNDLDDVRRVAQIRKDHVVSHRADGSDPDTHGWIESEIDRFEDRDGDIALIIRHPWGEEATYTFDKKGLFNGNMADICGAYGVEPEEFESLVGEHVWTKVKSLEVEDGDVKSDTRMRYRACKLGPKYHLFTTIRKFVKLGLLFLVIFILTAIPYVVAAL